MQLIKGIAASLAVVTLFSFIKVITGIDTDMAAGWFAGLAFSAATEEKKP